jgi:hypothetical protein
MDVAGFLLVLSSEVGTAIFGDLVKMAWKQPAERNSTHWCYSGVWN